MAKNGTLKYGLHKTPVLGNNLTSYNGLFTLKQDDPDGHARALIDLLGSQELADTFKELEQVHVIGFFRIGRDKVFIQSNFDGGDLVSYWEIIINAAPDLVKGAIAHFEGEPGSDADVTTICEFLASAQVGVDVVAYYCGYPSLTVTQIYRDVDWRNKVMDLQKSLAKPAENVVEAAVSSAA